MSFGKGGGTTIQTAQPTPEQTALIKAQTDALTSTFLPSYQQAVGGAQTYLNNLAPNVAQAAQNLQGTAAQAQNVLGSTGESALRTGISGLQNLFGKDYEQQQINAAMAPAQMQYQQNVANQQAQFGATGNLGSARQALAGRQLAGQTQATQAATAANILKDIEAQRAAAAGPGGLDARRGRRPRTLAARPPTPPGRARTRRLARARRLSQVRAERLPRPGRRL